MPEELLQRLIAARNFNMGFATVEYVASALVDLDFHSQPATEAIDAGAFEKKSLERIGMPDEIVMRHRPPHFGHIFSGGSYAAAYYSYMWSEVLDADAFAAFEEKGDIFDPATAKRLHDAIYSAGGRQDPAEAYKAFRGRLPSADALLKKRGFIEPAPSFSSPASRGG
jgi:peptidyl-dipeptidase Dcp